MHTPASDQKPAHHRHMLVLPLRLQPQALSWLRETQRLSIHFVVSLDFIGVYSDVPRIWRW